MLGFVCVCALSISCAIGSLLCLFVCTVVCVVCDCVFVFDVSCPPLFVSCASVVWMHRVVDDDDEEEEEEQEEEGTCVLCVVAWHSTVCLLICWLSCLLVCLGKCYSAVLEPVSQVATCIFSQV